MTAFCVDDEICDLPLNRRISYSYKLVNICGRAAASPVEVERDVCRCVDVKYSDRPVLRRRDECLKCPTLSHSVHQHTTRAGFLGPAPDGRCEPAWAISRFDELKGRRLESRPLVLIFRSQMRTPQEGGNDLATINLCVAEIIPQVLGSRRLSTADRPKDAEYVRGSQWACATDEIRGPTSNESWIELAQ